MHAGERESAWLLLLYVFFPLGLPYANWAQPGVLFYMKSSLPLLDLSLTFVCSIFVGFSLPCLLATTILDSFSLFYLSNNRISKFIVIHTVKGFDIVNKAEIHVFLELCWFFHDPADVGNLISGSSAFSKTSLNIREFMVHVVVKPGLENFEHYFTSM